MQRFSLNPSQLWAKGETGPTYRHRDVGGGRAGRQCEASAGGGLQSQPGANVQPRRRLTFPFPFTLALALTSTPGEGPAGAGDADLAVGAVGVLVAAGGGDVWTAAEAAGDRGPRRDERLTTHVWSPLKKAWPDFPAGGNGR